MFLKGKRGFTIIELLIVMLVIAILLGIFIPRIRGMQDEANITKARAELRTVETALVSFYMHQTPNSYPATSTGVAGASLVAQTPNILNVGLADPFRTSREYDYIRSANGNFYVIYSVGPDGAAGVGGINNTGTITGTIGDDVCRTNGGSTC